MRKMTELLSTNLGKKLLAGSLCALLVGITLPASAGYQPPKQRSMPRRSGIISTGRRGCSGIGIGMTALAPQAYLGQTTSTHPTFAWFVPDKDHKEIKFYLYELSGSQERLVVHRASMQSKPGLMQYTLPQNQMALQVGRQYRWRAAIICDPKRPSNIRMAQADFEVIAVPSPLKQQLATVRDPLQRVNLFAESGLWYDAFGTALDSQTSSASSLQLDLLRNLAETETAVGQPGVENPFVSQLREVMADLKKTNQSQLPIRTKGAQ